MSTKASWAWPLRAFTGFSLQPLHELPPGTISCNNLPSLTPHSKETAVMLKEKVGPRVIGYSCAMEAATADSQTTR